MKKNIAKLMLVLIVGAVLLTGCRDTGDNDPPDTPKDTATQSVAPEEIKYKSVSVRDYEPCHEMKTPTFFESAEINGNTYQFHPEVSEEDKTRFIDSQRILLDKLEEKRGEAVEGCTFRVFNIYASRSDSDLSTAYYGMDDAESWKHILATVQAIYGDTTTYGYVYAMADALSAELGWKADVKESSSSPSVFYETPELLTLTYPCFTQRYVTAGQKNAAVALSIDVFGKMAKPYSGEHEFIQKVKEYGADNGIEYPKIDFRFTSASEYCVLGIETDYLDILIDNTYEFDFYFSGTAYQYDSWESDLTTMYAKLGHVVSRLKTVREKLGGEPPERATIRLTHGGERFTLEEFSQYSYVTDENIPYCMLTHSVNTIVEIYTRYAIESVADAETYNGWYYNMLYLYLAHEETSAVYRDAMTYDEKKWAEYYTGGSIDTPEGMMKYYEVIIHKNSGETEPKKWVTDLDPYWEAVCFADYLVREYGEKSFIQLMLHPTRNMEYLGTQTYKVLFQWEEYILNECPKIYPAVADPYLIYLPTTTQKLWNDGYKENVNGGNTYRFDSTISADDRSAIMQKQNALLAHIEKEIGRDISGLTVLVTDEGNGRSHSDSGLVFFGVDKAGTWEQIYATLGTVYGDYTSYGYLYALSDKIAASLGWTRDTVGTVDTSVFADNPMLVSLTAPCFLPQYSTEKEIGTARALAIDLLGKMTAPYGGDSEFESLISSYAASQNIPYKPTYLRFAYNGRTCPVKVKTNTLEMFVSSTYTADSYYKQGRIDENWLENISSIIPFIEATDAEIDEANKFFGYEPDFLLPVWLKGEVIDVYPDGYVETLDGIYKTGYLYMEVSGIATILHEYVHHIDNMISPYCPEVPWAEEALAYYYAREDCYEGYVSTLEPSDYEFFTYYQGSTLETLEEFLISRDITIYSWYPDYMPESFVNGEMGYGMSVLSLASYIVNNWGEDKFYQMMIDPNCAEDLIGKPLTEVVSEWSDYIIYEIPELYPKLKEN